MNLSKALLTMMLALGVNASAYAKVDKWYRVEMIIFEMDDKSAFMDDIANAGLPSLGNAVALSSDPDAEFIFLTDKQLSLNDAKKRIQKRYHLVTHQGWRQVISDKEHSQKIHLMGGKNFSGEFEVDGTVRLSAGRNINVDADLLFRKPNEQGFQSYRLKESSRLRADELSYIDHPKYGVIVMVTPEKVIGEKPEIAEKPALPLKLETLPVTDDSPILPSARKALIQKGS